MTVRLLGFGYLYVTAEILGVAALATVWVATGGGRLRRRFIDATYRVQAWWTATLLRGVSAIFGLVFELDGASNVSPGPIVVLARHASIVDNLLPAEFVGRRHGINLRYVLKRELLGDPCLDVAGSRLPNYFVDRAAANPRAELAGIRALTTNLTAGDGVLIFPEGTRSTPARRRRALDELRVAASPLLDRAAGLHYVLPPKLGGVSALLSGARNADVVILAHSGLEGFARLSDVWRREFVNVVVRIKFWRVPAAQIPTDRSEREDWLFDQWEQMDRWIGRNATM